MTQAGCESSIDEALEVRHTWFRTLLGHQSKTAPEGRC